MSIEKKIIAVLVFCVQVFQVKVYKFCKTRTFYVCFMWRV
jgi:hypothetical protein